jgi:hypothetical protein
MAPESERGYTTSWLAISRVLSADIVYLVSFQFCSGFGNSAAVGVSVFEYEHFAIAMNFHLEPHADKTQGLGNFSSKS